MKKIFLSIAMVASLFSCSDQLDLVPLSTVTEPTFWKTPDDALSAINGTYRVLQNSNLYGGFFMHSDALTDNAYSHYTFYNYLEISTGSGFDSNSPLPSNLWNINYQGIVRANRVIKEVPNITMDETLKNRIIAESRFLRALFYFNLTTLYGDVPLILNIQTISESLVPRNTKSEVVAQILDDLTFASNNLPTSYSGANIGRATKGAALALKCRVHLFNKQYPETIAAANAVSALGYDLVSAADFPRIFSPALENNNKESIFEVQFLGKTGATPVVLGSNFNSTSGAMTQFGPAPYAPLKELFDIYTTGDIRLGATIIKPTDVFGGQTYTGNLSQTKYSYKKYVIPDATITTDGDANYIVLRYAEVLLSLAEAENELNGPTGAYAPMKKIRNRAGLTDLTAGLTKDNMRAAIKLERRKELAFEGLHYFDLLRYGATDLKEAMDNVTSISGHSRVFQSRFILWPIPQSQRTINPNLTQNTGW